MARVEFMSRELGWVCRNSIDCGAELVQEPPRSAFASFPVPLDRRFRFGKGRRVDRYSLADHPFKRASRRLRKTIVPEKPSYAANTDSFR